MAHFFHTLRSFPSAFWILVGATFVNRFGLFVIPFLTIFITRHGGSPTQAGIVVGAYALGGFGAAWLGGWMADRLGRRRTLAFAALSGAVCMLVMSQVHDWRWLCLVAFVTGIVADCGHPSSSALIQDLIPAERRVVAFAVQRFAINLGFAMGPAVAGFLVEKSFTWLFIIDAITSAFFGIVALKCLPDGRKTERHRAGWAHAWSSIRRNRPFLALFIACLGVSTLFRQLFAVFPLHYESSGMALQWLGLVLGLNGLIICLLEVPLAASTTRLPVRPVIATGYLLMGSSFLLFLLSGSLSVFIAVMVLFTCGEMLAFSRQQAYAASLIPDDMRGRYMAFLGLSWTFGGAIGSAGGLALYDHAPSILWTLAFLVGIASAWILVAGSRPKSERLSACQPAPAGPTEGP